MCVHGYDLAIVYVVVNVSLSGLKWALTALAQKHASKIGDRALAVVNFLLTCLSFLMANLPHPSTKGEEIK